MKTMKTGVNGDLVSNKGIGRLKTFKQWLKAKGWTPMPLRVIREAQQPLNSWDD